MKYLHCLVGLFTGGHINESPTPLVGSTLTFSKNATFSKTASRKNHANMASCKLSWVFSECGTYFVMVYTVSIALYCLSCCCTQFLWAQVFEKTCSKVHSPKSDRCGQTCLGPPTLAPFFSLPIENQITREEGSVKERQTNFCWVGRFRLFMAKILQKFILLSIVQCISTHFQGFILISG